MLYHIHISRLVPVGIFSAGSMHTRPVAAHVCMRVAVWLMETVRTQTAEPVLLVQAGASITARVRRALIHLYVTLWT